MQTMASILSGYLEDKNGVPVITKNGLSQLVKEQFPHCETKEIYPGVYEIKIPLVQLCQMSSSSPTEDLQSVTSGDGFIPPDISAMLTIELLEAWRERIFIAINEVRVVSDADI
ncbi:UNVERIFIED_CONTAM: hypothetical protein K2H54_025478 [Gekko kuhli]